MPPGMGVLVSGEAERVTHVQVTGDVRQRQHHHELLLAGRGLRGRREEAGALPPLVELGLDDRRPEILFAEVEHGCGRRRYLGHRSLLFLFWANKKRRSSQDEQRRRTTRASRATLTRLVGPLTGSAIRLAGDFPAWCQAFSRSPPVSAYGSEAG